MTSSEIHVQEVLNNLVSATNSIKRDGMDNLDESFTAAIATAAQAQAQTSAQQAQEQHDQHQVNQEELERIAQEHQHQTQTQEQGQDSQTEQSNLSAPASENSVIHVNALDAGNSSTLATVPITTASPAPPAKPVSGSEEWHKMRRDNHKEVERRRRENINAGINDLASVIPNPDKNKGAILRQAVKYIQTIQEAHQKALADNESLTSVQFERERALLEKNVAQNQLHTLIAENDQLKRDFEALRKEFDELEESKKRQRTE